MSVVLKMQHGRRSFPHSRPLLQVETEALLRITDELDRQ